MPIFEGDPCTAIFIDMRDEQIQERLQMVSGVHALIQRVAISALRQAQREVLGDEASIDHEGHDLTWRIPKTIMIGGGYDEFGMSTKLPPSAPPWSEVYDYKRAYFHRKAFNIALRHTQLFTREQYEFAAVGVNRIGVHALMLAADISAFCVMCRVMNPWDGRLVTRQYYDKSQVDAMTILRRATDAQWAIAKRNLVKRGFG